MESDLGLLGLLVFLAGLNERVAEEFFGGWLSGRYIKVLALATGIALVYGTYVIAPSVPVLGPIREIDPRWLWALGLLIGFGSHILHALLGRVAPDLLKNQVIAVKGPEPVTEPVKPQEPTPTSPAPLPPSPPDTRPTIVKWVDEINAVSLGYQGGSLTLAAAKAKLDEIFQRYKGTVPPRPWFPFDEGPGPGGLGP